MAFAIPSSVLQAFGLELHKPIAAIGSGHINKTYKVEGNPSFILQRINKSVFKNPQLISRNLQLAANHLRKAQPSYFFLTPLLSCANEKLVFDADGFAWRLYPFIENSQTFDQLESVQQAFSAASAFGQFNRLLSDANVNEYGYVLEGFHDLSQRYKQFEQAWVKAKGERKEKATQQIGSAQTFSFLTKQYEENIRKGVLKLRVMHNDTKINNILFDGMSGEAVTVIDLDTLMPGYFIYDLGDMVRTFVSPVSEEEKDLTKISFRPEFYEAVVTGYCSQMKEVLTFEELSLIPFAGKMMTYIMALRFLTDYLNGNVYYHTVYPEQNLVRASNQFHFLHLLHQNT